MSEKKIYYEVFSIQEFIIGKQIKNRWHRVGSAFPNNSGSFNLSLDLLPLPDPKTGKIQLHMRLPKPKEDMAPSNFAENADNYDDTPFHEYLSEMPVGEL